MGNDLGTVDATMVHGALHVGWLPAIKRALDNVGALAACTDAMLELFKGGYSFATFGDGVGELKVV